MTAVLQKLINLEDFFQILQNNIVFNNYKISKLYKYFTDFNLFFMII